MSQRAQTDNTHLLVDQMREHKEDDRIAFKRVHDSHTRLESKLDKLDEKLDKKLDDVTKKLDETCSQLRVLDVQRKAELKQQEDSKETISKWKDWARGIIGAVIVMALGFLLGFSQ